MKLFFIDGLKKGDESELTPPGISIGRELDNDIILEQEGASRYHSKLEWKTPSWILKDLGSTNGTKLNNKKMEPNEEIVLKDGDTILIGKQTMLFAEKNITNNVNFAPIPEPMDSTSPANPSIVTIPDMKPSTENKELDFSIDKKSSISDNDDLKINLFDNEDSAPKDSDNPSIDFFSKESSGDNNSKKKRHAGVLFYGGVIGVALLLIALFLLFEITKNESTTKVNRTTKKVRKGSPLFLRFEKQITTSSPKNNIFRFVMEIKDGTITITRDDLQTGLKDQPVRKIEPKELQLLEEKLKECDFMLLTQEPSGLPQQNEDKRLSLSIAYDNEFNSINVVNRFPPHAFDDAVNILEDFSDNVLQVRTISLTPAELRKDGLNAFLEAKQLFNNHLAEYGNLYKAKQLLKIAIENLGSFQPEPPEYNRAYKMREEISNMLKSQVDTHDKNGRRYIKLKQYNEAREEYKLIMYKIPPGSNTYTKVRRKVIQLDEMIKRNKRK